MTKEIGSKKIRSKEADPHHTDVQLLVEEDYDALSKVGADLVVRVFNLSGSDSPPLAA